MADAWHFHLQGLTVHFQFFGSARRRAKHFQEKGIPVFRQEMRKESAREKSSNERLKITGNAIGLHVRAGKGGHGSLKMESRKMISEMEASKGETLWSDAWLFT